MARLLDMLGLISLSEVLAWISKSLWVYSVLFCQRGVWQVCAAGPRAAMSSRLILHRPCLV